MRRLGTQRRVEPGPKNARHVIAVVVATALWGSIGLAQGAELYCCDDLEPQGSAAYTLNLKISTYVDEAIVPYQTDLRSTDATLSDDVTEFLATGDITSLIPTVATLNVLQNDILVTTLALEQHYRYVATGFAVATARPAEPDCVGRAIFEAPYVRYVDGAADPTPADEVRVEAEWERYYSFDRFPPESGTEIQTNGLLNPVVVLGSHDWPFEVQRNGDLHSIDYYNLNYSLYVNNNLEDYTGWFKLTPLSGSMCIPEG